MAFQGAEGLASCRELPGSPVPPPFMKLLLRGIKRVWAQQEQQTPHAVAYYSDDEQDKDLACSETLHVLVDHSVG